MDAEALLADLDERQRAAVVTPSTLVAVIAAAGLGQDPRAHPSHRLSHRRRHRRRPSHPGADVHPRGRRRAAPPAASLRAARPRRGRHVPLGRARSPAAAMGRHRPPSADDRRRARAAASASWSSRRPWPTWRAERTWAAARGVAPDAYAAAARAANRRRALPAARIAEALAAYETLKRRRGVIDLDDLLLAARPRADATTAASPTPLRWRFRHVLVDEAQDLNPVQHQLLRQLVGERRDLFLVGDPAQAIYGFNGSDPTLLADVDQHLPGIEIDPPADQLPLHAADRRRRPPRPRRRRVPRRRAVVARRRHAGGDRRRRRRARRGGPGGAHRPRPRRRRRAGGGVAVLARTHQQLARLDAGPRRRRRAGATRLARAGQPARGGGASGGAAVVGGPAAGLGPRRARGHADAVRRRRRGVGRAERRVAAAVLEFLRDRPDGNGVGAARVARRRPTPSPTPPRWPVSSCSTFHAAKGREWPTVVVTGVETGLVPHRTASTADAACRGGAAAARGVHPGRRPARDHPRPATRRLRPPAQPVRGRSRRVVATTGRAARRRARGARRPRLGRRRRSPGAPPRVARAGGAGRRPAARPALHRRRPGPARPHPAGRRRRAVVVDRARAAHRGARLPGGRWPPSTTRSPTPRADCGRRCVDDRAAVGQAAKSTTTGAWSLGCVPLRALRSITHQLDPVGQRPGWPARGRCACRDPRGSRRGGSPTTRTPSSASRWRWRNTSTKRSPISGAERLALGRADVGLADEGGRVVHVDVGGSDVEVAGDDHAGRRARRRARGGPPSRPSQRSLYW